MQMIPLALAEPEMVLARDIRRADNPQGPPICGRGTTLTESLIERLKNLGIKSITVEGHPVVIEGEKTLEDLLADLDRRFGKVANVPLMMRLKEIYRRIIIRSMGGEGGK
ncbi:hypothetical protein KI811_14080 [Geobacter hydrogenophilus]|uniref:Uncharacterized protein n=1 Tax=Geobacter hydrogenophilus TaxID=40983 RepID=A0A9W6FY94_9BACT|nr:hypothetical protein [Geobacter hydrogenophilus]MBT0894938.1 hypothetical protein [Geobacter hydrogenophilus]GLI37091.1 hypothetical protein GHYDROH2_05920 [Geobacter hydrogenophilus]